MSDIGMFTISKDKRTATGYLLPWGVRSKGVSSSNTKPITFPNGSVRLPRDPMVITLNDEHARFGVLGRASTLTPDDVGVLAEFALADTDEVDRWIDEHADRPVYFSAEIADMTRAPGDIGAGRLAGAAVTAAPAFDGTDAALALFSLLGEETELEDELEDELEEDTDEAPAAPDQEPSEDSDETEEEAVAEAIAPTGTFSRKPKADAPTLTKAGFFSAMRRARQAGDYSTLRPYLASAVDEDGSGLFALADIKYDGTGGLATDAGIPGAWLGELWQGNTQPRTVVPLLTAGTLTSMTAEGWIWTTKPTMASWAGNKNPVPSNTPTVAPKQFAAQRFAGGHDLAREYYDFGVSEVIDSYVQAMVDSYAKLSDDYALAQILAGAGSFTPGAATANKGLMAVIDGALAVVAAGATPSYSVVAPNVFRDIVSTPHSSALEYFDAAVNLTDGSSAGFSILPDARLAAGQVVVGAKQAATAWELPGVPIRVSAPDLVKGGVDNAFFGYIAVGVTYPAALVKGTVTIAAAAAK